MREVDSFLALFRRHCPDRRGLGGCPEGERRTVISSDQQLDNDTVGQPHD